MIASLTEICSNKKSFEAGIILNPGNLIKKNMMKTNLFKEVKPCMIGQGGYDSSYLKISESNLNHSFLINFKN